MGFWCTSPAAVPVSVVRAASTSIFTNMNVTGVKSGFLEGKVCSTSKSGTLFPLGWALQGCTLGIIWKRILYQCENTGIDWSWPNIRYFEVEIQFSLLPQMFRFSFKSAFSIIQNLAEKPFLMLYFPVLSLLLVHFLGVLFLKLETLVPLWKTPRFKCFGYVFISRQ